MPHLQVRASVKEQSGGSLGAAIAGEAVQANPYAVRPGALVALLEILARADFNLRSAGGHGLEVGGRFVFSVDAESEDQEEERAKAARDLLRENGYADAEVYEVHHEDLDDEPGQLEAYLRTFEDELIHELFVATPDRDSRRIPVQVTTIRVESAAAATSGGGSSAS